MRTSGCDNGGAKQLLARPGGPGCPTLVLLGLHANVCVRSLITDGRSRPAELFISRGMLTTDHTEYASAQESGERCELIFVVELQPVCRGDDPARWGSSRSLVATATCSSRGPHSYIDCTIISDISGLPVSCRRIARSVPCQHG